MVSSFSGCRFTPEPECLGTHTPAAHACVGALAGVGCWRAWSMGGVALGCEVCRDKKQDNRDPVLLPVPLQNDGADVEAEMARLRQQVAQLVEKNQALEIEVAASVGRPKTHLDGSARPSPPKRRASSGVSPNGSQGIPGGASHGGSSASSSVPLSAMKDAIAMKTPLKMGRAASESPQDHGARATSSSPRDSRGAFESAAARIQQVDQLRRGKDTLQSAVHASPLGRHLTPLTLQRAETVLLPDTMPAALLFPNQAPNLTGMFRDRVAPLAQDLLRRADGILGYNLEQLCADGVGGSAGKRQLDDTVHCQPAVYVAGLAAVERLKLSRPEAVSHCQAVAGFGVGEYAALQVAGVFSFEEGLDLVRIRAEEMQAAAQKGVQRQLLLTGVELDRVRMLCEEARRKCGEGEVCSVAYAVMPKGHICAGTEAAANELYQIGRSKHSGVDVRASLLETRQELGHGAFQTQLMDEAQRNLREALRKALPKMRPPRCAVYFNTMGEALPAGADPSLIVDLLATQLTSTVLWEQTIRTMIREGIDEFIVCGPSTTSQLQDVMWKISSDAGRRTKPCNA